MSIYDVEVIEVEHLPQKLSKYNKKLNKKVKTSLTEILEETEKNIIMEALMDTGNNITHTAEILKIPRQTLQYKISKYNLK